MGGTNITNIRYADDTVLMANDAEKLQILVNEVNRQSKALGMNINPHKSVCMVVSKSKHPPNINIKIDDEPLKYVKSYTYLGALVTSDGKSINEIKRRITLAKITFNKLKRILMNRNIRISTKDKILKSCVWSVLSYGCESWNINKNLLKSLEACEVWCWRKILKIKWSEFVSNDKIWRKIGTKKYLVRSIQKRQLEFLGHIIRKGGIEAVALTGKVEGKSGRGRKRASYLSNLPCENWTTEKIIHTAYDRSLWNSMLVNVWCNQT